MPDYSKGKIYKICSDDPDITEVYIGSTVRTLNVRMSAHRHDFLKDKTRVCASYKMFDKYGIDKCHIKLIENFTCKSEKELLIREQYYIDTTNECINEMAAFRTEEQRQAYIKKYNDDHKEQRQQYHAEHKEKRNEQSRLYHAEHKEKYNEQTRLYHAEHKVEIRMAASKKCMCICGIEYTHNHKSRHIKTQAHIDALTIINLKHQVQMLQQQLQEHQAHAPTSE